MFVHVLMIPVGLFALGWGFWASHNAKKPFDVIGSFVILIGFAVAILGTLLVCVPGFFS
jgi:drug/metabolite transporter superfamily protein YnfA